MADKPDLMDVAQESLARLANHFAPSAEQRREKRLQILLLKTISFIGLLGGAFVGAKEGWKAYSENVEINKIAEGYFHAAEVLYYTDNNPQSALKFIETAQKVLPNTPKYIRFEALIKGLSTAKMFSNLNAPPTPEQLQEAFQAKGLAELLIGTDADPGVWANSTPTLEQAQGHFLAGQFYAALAERNQDTNLMDQAKGQLERALKKFNGDPALVDQKGMANVRLAQLEFRSITPKNDDIPSDSDSASEKIKKRVIEPLTKTIDEDPDNKNNKWAYFWRGLAYFKQYSLKEDSKDLGNARADFKKAIDLDPRFDLACTNYGWTLIKVDPDNQKIKEGREQLIKALEINPGAHEALDHLSYSWAFENRYDRALLYSNQAISLDPRNWEYLDARARLYGELNDWDLALGDLDEAIKSNPDNENLNLKRAKALLNTGKIPEAIESLLFLEKTNPDFNKEKMLGYLGEAYMKADSFLNAERRLTEIPEMNSDHLVLRSEARMKLGKFDEALTDAINAVASKKKSRTFLQLARVYKHLKKDTDALKNYQEVGFLDNPDKEELHAALFEGSNLAKEMGDLKAARKLIDKLIEREPTCPEARALQALLPEVNSKDEPLPVIGKPSIHVP